MSQNLRLTEDQTHEIKQALLLRIRYLRSIDTVAAPLKAGRYVETAILDCEAIYADLCEDAAS